MHDPDKSSDTPVFLLRLSVLPRQLFAFICLCHSNFLLSSVIATAAFCFHLSLPRQLFACICLCRTGLLLTARRCRFSSLPGFP
jgi:hypothetical protein